MLLPALDLIRGNRGEEAGPRIAIGLEWSVGGGNGPVSYFTRCPDLW